MAELMKDHARTERRAALCRTREVKRGIIYSLIGVTCYATGILTMLAAWDYRDRTYLDTSLGECRAKYGPKAALVYDTSRGMMACTRVIK